MSPHRWNDIAMVFQGAMNAFNPVQTVGSQIEEPMELHDVAEGRLAAGRRRSCSSAWASPRTGRIGSRTSSRAG